MFGKLESFAKESKTLLCFGIDPVIEKMPGSKSGVRGRIIDYYSEITDLLLEEGQISAIKPNYAYFAQHGFDGLNALKDLLDRYRNRVYIILDVKRGDIGRTGDAYAKEIYDFWGADACTVSPYMGEDSVLPFAREGKLPYILCRTSNSGAGDFQEQKLRNGRLFYELVAEKSIAWNCGLVVGATSDSIKRIVKITKNNVPLLIPGIGAQGGDLEMVLGAIKQNPYLHRINCSSSLAFAPSEGMANPARASLREAERINTIIRGYL